MKPFLIVFLLICITAIVNVTERLKTSHL